VYPQTKKLAWACVSCAALALVMSPRVVWPGQQAPAPASPPGPSPTTPAVPATAAPPKTSPAPAAAAPPNPRKDAWNCLMDGMADKDFDQRTQAIVALGTIGRRPDVVRLVEQSLTDTNSTVREAAATTLGVMKSRTSIPKLRAALDDDSAAVSFSAARSLWNMGDKTGESILIEVMEGDRKASAGAVHSGLRQFHEKLHSPVALAELGAQAGTGIFFPPAGFGVMVVSELTKDKASAARAIAAEALGENSDTEAHEALREALEDKSWVVRSAAAEAFGQHASQDDIAMFASLLNDSHYQVRFRAAAVIVRMSTRS
jgi:HEAT repeat protein